MFKPRELILQGPLGPGGQVYIAFTIGPDGVGVMAHDAIADNAMPSNVVRFRYSNHEKVVAFLALVRKAVSNIAQRVTELKSGVVQAFREGKRCFIAFVSALANIAGPEFAELGELAHTLAVERI